MVCQIKGKIKYRISLNNQLIRLNFFTFFLGRLFDKDTGESSMTLFYNANSLFPLLRKDSQRMSQI